MSKFKNYLETARTSYKKGQKFRISGGSGLMSDKEVEVIDWFDWKKADDGTYSLPDRKKQVPIKYDGDKKGFMYKSRLIPLNEEEKKSDDKYQEILDEVISYLNQLSQNDLIEMILEKMSDEDVVNFYKTIM